MKAKKLFFSIASCIISTVCSATYDVTGNITPCANMSGSDTDPNVYTYSVSDIPSSAFNISIIWSYGNANVVGNFHDATINLWWPNNGCSYFGSVNVSGIDYDMPMPADASHPNPWIQHVQDNNPHYLSVSITALPGIIPSGTWITSVPVCNTNNITYSINSICGATSYQWAIPIGWAAQTNLTGTSIVVTPNGSSGGIVSVVATNSSNGCNLTQTYSKTITRTAEAPSFSNAVSGLCTPNNPSYNFNINAVTNAASYSWSFPPVSWLCVTRGHPLTASINFEGTAASGNICVSSNFACGQSSAPTCFNLTTYNVIPTVPSAEPTYTVAATSDPSKKAITFKFPAWSTPYTWSGTLSGNTSAFTGGNSGTCYFIMTNNQTIQFNYTASNACGNSTPTDGFLYKLVNGAIVRQPLQRASLGQNNETAIVSEIGMFPSPAKEKLNIVCTYNDRTVLDIFLIDILGNELRKQSKVADTGRNEFELDLAGVSNGIYYVRIITETAQVTKKIIVSK